MSVLTEREQFFYDHAGFSFDPLKETREEGHIACARALAAAEETMQAGPYRIEVEPDDVPWDGDVPYDGPLWCVTLVQGGGWLMDRTVLGSLGSVACTEDSPYLRVVAAELAHEHIVLPAEIGTAENEIRRMSIRLRAMADLPSLARRRSALSDAAEALAMIAGEIHLGD